MAGRAARNVNGRVILYGDTITPSMKELIDGSADRRKRQMAYNREHNITPKTIVRNSTPTIGDIVGETTSAKRRDLPDSLAGTVIGDTAALTKAGIPAEEAVLLAEELEREMLAAADALEFERAAVLRDRLRKMRRGK